MTETKIMGAALTILTGIITLTAGFEYSNQWQQRWVDLATITGIITILAGIGWLATTIRNYLAYEASLILLHDLIKQARKHSGIYRKWADNGDAYARGLADGAADLLKCLEDYEASMLDHSKLPDSFHDSELELLEATR